VPTQQEAEVAGNTLDVDVDVDADQQVLIGSAGRDSLSDIPLHDVPVPDVPLPDVPLPDVPFPETSPDGSVGEG
jgi:hypothetical protein